MMYSCRIYYINRKIHINLGLSEHYKIKDCRRDHCLVLTCLLPWAQFLDSEAPVFGSSTTDGKIDLDFCAMLFPFTPQKVSPGT